MNSQIWKKKKKVLVVQIILFIRVSALAVSGLQLSIRKGSPLKLGCPALFSDRVPGSDQMSRPRVMAIKNVGLRHQRVWAGFTP